MLLPTSIRSPALTRVLDPNPTADLGGGELALVELNLVHVDDDLLDLLADLLLSHLPQLLTINYLMHLL